MKAAVEQFSVPLSRLSPSRRNPRKVKPGREADQRLVALIRSQGLLQPLVVRPIDGKPKHYEIVAGDRRLRALREIHRNDGDPKIACFLREVDQVTADALSLGENFGREATHPLDEVEAFEKLATADGKDAATIGAEFGVKERYVRQRMKLATLAKPVKEAYREGKIDTSSDRCLWRHRPGHWTSSARADKLGSDDQNRVNKLQQRFQELDAQEEQIVAEAPEFFSELTKAIATSFLILDPDFRVHREYRVPRQRHRQPAHSGGAAAVGGNGKEPEQPTSDELSDSQLAATFTHQALAVRQAVLKNPAVRTRILAMLLHEKVGSEALAIRHEANGATLHAASEGFSPPPAFERLREKRSKLDPFHAEHYVEERQAWARIGKLSPSKLDALIELLIAASPPTLSAERSWSMRSLSS